ncbi:type II toxin-antitoxin system RelE/ParE family toxin [Endothiovibrio diazotrophicus]
MSEERKIEVFEARTFTKALARLNDAQRDLVDDEIEKIIADPEIGEQKKGDLAHIRVHKFKLETREVLLGYSWKEEQLVIYLLYPGPHENFYRDAKKRRKADLRIIR